MGVFGDHIIASDGIEWAYAAALAESDRPAVRVNPGGAVFLDDLAAARSYWEVYERAINDCTARSPTFIKC